MTLYYHAIIGRKGNIAVDNDLTVDIRNAESERACTHFVRLKVVVWAAGQRRKFAVLVEVFQLCYRVAVISYLNTAPVFGGTLLVFV